MRACIKESSKAGAAWRVIEAAQQQSRLDEEKKRQKERIDALLGKVSPRFLGKTFADFSVTNALQGQVKKTVQYYVETFADRLQEASSLMFVGKPGTGKTLLALIMYQALVKAGFMAEYQASLNFLRHLQEKQYESHRALEQALHHYQQLPFLIIDEVTEGCGKGAYPADWERNLLRMLIDVRYQANRCTLIISNRTKDELLERIGEPTIDRLCEGGATLAFTWDSHRQK